MPSSDDLLWYAGYGSNLDPARFDCYLMGGAPPGATRGYPGTRDAVAARETRALTVPGRVTFAWESPTWHGGGVAFFDAQAPGPLDGESPVSAYLITRRQFSDVLEQEMWRDPGIDHDLTAVWGEGRHAVGPGHYETVVMLGEMGGHPVLTFTAAELPAVNSPDPGYLATMVRGLRGVHGWDDDQIVDYLLGCAGAAPTWTRDALRRAVLR